MNKHLSSLINKITPNEEKEVENFINYLIIRRKINKYEILHDDISSDELTKIISESGSFDWLNSDKEDIYSSNDGVPVQW
ncbi:hypothetical protein JXB41_06750 [Candidatus Woesearchaeota archaeon]|nr:hypothetical protein [Candidatus Woesearchaeota archaeon]